MSVTNGFLRLVADSLETLKSDAAAFESRCRNYDDPNYLDMDKAGYELLFILDPSSIEFDNPDAETPFPAIADVLGGGTTLHKDIDLGYGPAKIISRSSMKNAIQELDAISLNTITEMAMSNDILPEVLMCELDQQTIETYHWPYLQSLRSFIQDAVGDDMAVIRY